MSNLVAAILRPQLAQVDARNERWRRIYNRLARQIAEIPHLEVPARPQEEEFAPTSIQFSITGIERSRIAQFVEEAAAHGVHVKWFGAADPIGFTSRHDHWRYVENRQSVPGADQLLAGLCDLRLPLSLTSEDCDTIAKVLDEAMWAIGS
nr:DegT/DnrJ/EryC1/StrS aminotransferase family protein [Desulfuromonadales bacterium]